MHLSKLRTFIVRLLLLAAVTLNLRAAAPAPAELLPDDTLAVFTVPQWTQLNTYWRQSPSTKLWSDPSMKPFTDKFVAQCREKLVVPLERELGVSFASYAELLQGQLTLAVTRGGWTGGAGETPGILLLIDAGENKGKLADQIQQLRRKLADSGKALKNDTVRGVEFSTFTVRAKDVQGVLNRAFDSSKGEASDSDESFPLIFGVSDSVLIVANKLAEAEKVIARQSGSGVPPLSEQAVFQRDFHSGLRGKLGYGWISLAPLVKLAQDQLGKMEGMNNPMGVDPKKIFEASGLTGLRSLSLSFSGNEQGGGGEFFLNVPEEGRKGLFRIFLPENKDASPPQFIPADVLKFSRWRIDGQKVFRELEALIGNISPQLATFVQFALSTAGKDKDPNFDLRKNLIGNVGDDFITFEKAPREATVEALASPPAIFLIGSPHPDQLTAALRAVVSLMPVDPSSGVKEREFVGRKIYSVSMPQLSADGEPVQRSIHFAGSGAYVALSSDTALLEEYLRNAGEAAGQPLRGKAGLTDAAQKIGGTQAGVFGYEDQKRSMRAVVETLRSDKETLAEIATAFSGMGGGDAKLTDWLDFSLLPPFERIEKYFTFAVFGIKADPVGIRWQIFAPEPRVD